MLIGVCLLKWSYMWRYWLDTVGAGSQREPFLKVDTDGFGQMAAGGSLQAAPRSDIIRPLQL